jgi:hypothetical protein
VRCTFTFTPVLSDRRRCDGGSQVGTAVLAGYRPRPGWCSELLSSRRHCSNQAAKVVGAFGIGEVRVP